MENPRARERSKRNTAHNISPTQFKPPIRIQRAFPRRDGAGRADFPSAPPSLL